MTNFTPPVMLGSLWNSLTRLQIIRGHIVAGSAVSLAALLINGALNGPQVDVDASIATHEQPIEHHEIFAELAALSNNGSEKKSLILEPGDSLGALLQKHEVEPQTAYQVTKVLSQVYNPRDLRAGQKVSLYLDEHAELYGVSLKPNFERALHINRQSDGSFAARDIAIEFPKELAQVSGTIENSLYLDAGTLGVPDKVTVQFSQIYEHSVDFQRDIQPGDNFAMAFELYRDERGNPLKAGDLLYTSFSPRGKTADYYLYKNKAGSENYYGLDGKSAKRKLMRTPINGARLSSGFGKRRHPISGYRKSHNGVDFAARSGTPIMAAGVGTVERANRWSTYGNYVRIRHSDGYKTAYAHLKSFARGIKAGSRVRQGQTIGYVGTTGASTGPHLHYEVIKNGRKINPRSLSTLSGKPLPKNEKADFDARRKQIDELRADAPPALKPAKITPDAPIQGAPLLTAQQ